MAIVEGSRLTKNGLPVVSEETVEVIENLADTAFWQLMLGDDLDVCDRDVNLLCATLRYRMAQIRIAARQAGTARLCAAGCGLGAALGDVYCPGCGSGVERVLG